MGMMHLIHERIGTDSFFKLREEIREGVGAEIASHTDNMDCIHAFNEGLDAYLSNVQEVCDRIMRPREDSKEPRP